MFVVREPILTEKSFSKIKDRVYVFKVERTATKARIKTEIEFIFNVKVKRVNTLRDPLRRHRVGRFSGFRSRFKRAILYLEDGYSISIYPDEDKKEGTVVSETTASVASDSQSSSSKAKEIDPEGLVKVRDDLTKGEVVKDTPEVVVKEGEDKQSSDTETAETSADLAEDSGVER